MKHSEEHAKKVLSQEKDLKLQGPPADELRIVREGYFGLRQLPEIREDSVEGVVFYVLNVCYFNAGNVCEGKVKDVVWGFRQSGIPAAIAWDGLKKLKELGYITWTDEHGVQIFGDINEHVWYKWTEKFFPLLAENTRESINVPNHNLITNTWDNIK